MLLLEICFLIAGGRAVVLLFPVKLSSSGATVRATRFHKALVGEAFSITCLCIPVGTDDKEALSCVANLSCFEK